MQSIPVFDLSAQVWAYIFLGAVAAFVIALRVTDPRHQRKR